MSNHPFQQRFDARTTVIVKAAKILFWDYTRAYVVLKNKKFKQVSDFYSKENKNENVDDYISYYTTFTSPFYTTWNLRLVES